MKRTKAHFIFFNENKEKQLKRLRRTVMQYKLKLKYLRTHTSNARKEIEISTHANCRASKQPTRNSCTRKALRRIIKGE